MTVNAPWTLRLDTDGTEDIAVVLDREGEVLATSRPFWRAADPSPTLDAVTLMRSAPALLEALQALRSANGANDFNGWHPSFDEAIAKARAAIALAITITL